MRGADRLQFIDVSVVTKCIPPHVLLLVDCGLYCCLKGEASMLEI